MLKMRLLWVWVVPVSRHAKHRWQNDENSGAAIAAAAGSQESAVARDKRADAVQIDRARRHAGSRHALARIL